MSEINTPIEPNPEFASRLRCQLASELRRRRFVSERPKTGRLRIAVILAIAALTGFAVASATHRYQQSAQKELLVAQERAHIDLGEARLELAESYISELQERYQADPSLRETILVSQYELHQVERELLRNRLNLEEVSLTGQPPSNSLTAPLVQGRDFVSERLELELAGLLERAGMIRDEISELESTETAEEHGLKYASLELSSILERINNIGSQLEVRRDFLAGRRTAKEVVLESKWAEIQARIKNAEDRVEAAQYEVGRVREMYAEGSATLLDLRQAEFQFKQAQTEQALAQLERDFIVSQLPD